MNLSRTAISRPIGTLIIYGVIMLIGLTALAGLPIDLLPDISFARLSVSTNYAGAGPEEVENLVTRVIEEAVSTVAGVQDVTSSSSEGSSRVTVTFPFGTDLDAAANDVRAAIERTRRRLPEGVDAPVIFKFDPSQSPIIQLGLVAAGSTLTVTDLRQLADEQIVFRLERIRGVALVDVRGGGRPQIHVDLDQTRMRALAASETEVLRALASANLAGPAGEVIEGTRRLGLRALSRFRNLDQIRATVVAVRNRVPVYLRDIARVSAGTEETTGIVRVNGRPGVLLQIQRQPGTNTVAVSDAVTREVASLNGSLPGATIQILGDSSRFIRNSITSVRQAIMMGGLLAILILFVFLRGIRSVLVLSTSIPIAILGNFGLMYFFGYTLNLMTLGGLALGIGMLTDTSIVVLENIFRLREGGMSGRHAAVQGTAEVVSPVLASTLTTVVVFLPIIFLRSGIVTTQMYFQFSVVVIFALICSFAVSITLTPVLASWLPPMRQADRGWTVWLAETYRGALDWCLRHRTMVLGASGLIFVVGMAAYTLLGHELLPVTDEGEIFISADLPVGTRLDLTDQALQRLERAIRTAAPEVQDVTITAGSAGFGARSHRGNLRLRLAPRGQRNRSTDEIANALRRTLQIPGGRVLVRPSAGALSLLRFATTTDPVDVEIRGFDLSQSNRLAQQVRSLLEDSPGITDVSVAREELVPELSIRIDPQRAAAFGLNPAQVMNALRVAVAGDVATIFREGGREWDVVVRLRERDRLGPLDVLAIPITTPAGTQITLGQVAELARDVSPPSIVRNARQRVVSVTAGLTGRDYGSAMADVRARLGALTLPPGFTITYGEDFAQQQRANRQLGFGFLLALVLVYAVMAIQFEALLEPLLIMGSVPFALGGSFLLLFLTNTTVNIQSQIGLVVLVGVVVNNAIVLMDFILVRHRKEGMPLYQAAAEAASVRLRPVLMTTLTTVLGLLPVAIGIGEGAELQAPMARSVIGGLSMSTLVTLILIPTLYVAVEEAKVNVRRRRDVRAGAREPLPVTGGGNGSS